MKGCTAALAIRKMQIKSTIVLIIKVAGDNLEFQLKLVILSNNTIILSQGSKPSSLIYPFLFAFFFFIYF